MYLISGCLLGHNCKYNGGNNLDEKVVAFVQGHEVIPVCPEEALGIPRVPMEIVGGVLILGFTLWSELPPRKKKQ